jgi:hypothetical protein
MSRSRVRKTEGRRTKSASRHRIHEGPYRYDEQTYFKDRAEMTRFKSAESNRELLECMIKRAVEGGTVEDCDIGAVSAAQIQTAATKYLPGHKGNYVRALLRERSECRAGRISVQFAPNRDSNSARQKIRHPAGACTRITIPRNWNRTPKKQRGRGSIRKPFTQIRRIGGILRMSDRGVGGPGKEFAPHARSKTKAR